MSSNGMRVCARVRVCMCVCARMHVYVHTCVHACMCVRVYGMNLKYAVRWHIHIIISSFRTMPVLYTHTRILRSFEDSELAGLKVDIALTQLDLE